MTSIYDFTDYKKFVKSWLKNQPKEGHGQYRKFAESLGLSTVMVSQIFNGDKDLSLDHGYKLALYLGLTEAQTQFFLLLVQVARASSPDLKAHLQRQMAR
ncbi:MAG: helix-turn-helix domain-containing protein, partial [Bdellovibrionales bacterium]|nr:helix-turn-helix domain-containing protein [Bdellovibrionales bacterium]